MPYSYFVQKVVVCIVWLAASLWARGAVLLSDYFNYANGPLVNVSGGQWANHSGSTGQVDVISGRVFLSQSESEDVNAPLATSSASVLYASLKVNFTNLPSGAAGYFAHFKDGGTLNLRGRIFATNTGGGFFQLGVANASGSPNVLLATNLSLNTDYRVVVRYVVGGGTTLWLNPGQESDGNVTASDAASSPAITTFALRQSSGIGNLFIDDLRVGTSFSDVVSNTPPSVTTQPESQTVVEGAEVTFSVEATGSSPLSYQWQFNGSNIVGATSALHILPNTTVGDAGVYRVIVSNYFGSVTSSPATLTITLPTPSALSVLTYNVHGAAVDDWSTNSAQVRAIGRQVVYLNPDVITFQEIPFTNSYEMTNFVKAFLPGYSLAMNSGTDGFIRSVIASRYPITRSKSWLDSSDLNPFGYTNSNFTRDLFEAQMNVPGFETPLHVFTTHLKSGNSSSDDAAKRAAEASAVSNFFVTGFLSTNAGRAYLLMGDLNEDIARPSTGSQQPIQRLVNSATGLQLTTPVNPFTASELTFSIQATNLTKRYDYILPCGLLASNIVSSQIFRSDQLNPPPPNLFTNDTRTASDHLPVLMTFSNPFNRPYRIRSVALSNQMVTLNWQSGSNRQYRVEASADLTNWTKFAANLTSSGTNFTLTTNVNGSLKFFRVYRLF